MSPTEDQLRRALREGQGAAPDPDVVLSRAVAYRSQRRVRIASTIAAVAVVAGLGTGVGLVAGRSTDNRADSGSSVGSARAPEDASAAAGGSAGTGQAGAAASVPQVPSCPATLPAINRGSGSANLFTADVASMTVCGYLGTGAAVRDSYNGNPLTRTFTGADASAIAKAINAAPSRSELAACGYVPANGLHTLLLLARYSSGSAAHPVVAGAGCDSFATNGYDDRYEVSSIAALQPFVTTLRQAAQSPFQLPKPAPSPATT